MKIDYRKKFWMPKVIKTKKEDIDVASGKRKGQSKNYTQKSKVSTNYIFSATTIISF